MSDTHPNPPRWAHALLRASLRPSEIDCVTGDLLEEYREVRRPSLGRGRANRWYVRHALSVLWRLAWPFVLAIVAFRLLSFPLPRGWNPSVVPAPGVSLVDAVIFLCAGYYGAQRTGRIVTGSVTAGSVSALGIAAFMLFAALRMPGLLAVPFEQPFVVVILLTIFAIALAFGVAVGTVGAVVGRFLPPSAISGQVRRIWRIDVA